MGPAREILIGVFATLAKFESQRRSGRTQAGLARRKAEGLPIGRQPGATDKNPRKRCGGIAARERMEAGVRSRPP
jgi:putative DNA-invertase from lambdoid prophage Rac